jgi:hypothetical protein
MIMVEFDNKEEEKPVELELDYLDKLDTDLEKKQTVLAKLNQSTDRTDNSVMLHRYVTEARNRIWALREMLWLCDSCSQRIK